MKEQLNILKSCIGKNIFSLSCDEVIYQLNSARQINCHVACLLIDSIGRVEIDFEEESHFYGECDLILNVVDGINSIVLANDLGKISEVIYWVFTPVGFNIFPKKYLVHIELITSRSSMSIGFVRKNQDGDLMVDISSIHISAELINGYGNNLERKILN